MVPVVIGNREFAALDAMLADFAEYRTILVPMMVPPIPARRQVDRLAALAQGRAEVAPPVSEHRWIRRRLRRSALVAQANPGQRLQRAAGEFRAVARTIEEAISG